jgi:hypothetical protein
MSTHEDATRKPSSPSIYAAFADPASAERAAEALVASGVRADDISLVVNREEPAGNKTLDDRELDYSQPTRLLGPAGATGRFDPLGNDLRVSTPTPVQGGNLMPIGESAEMNLNPAQNDYPIEDVNQPTAFSSRPPNAKSDYNPDLDKREYNADYKADVDRENREEARLDLQRRMPDQASAESDTGPVDTPNRPTPVYDYRDERTGTAPHAPDTSGIHHESISDAASTAKKGVVAGLGVGALAALTAIAVPGIGLVIGGGALALALGGLAAGARAGHASGGVVSYLKDHGVPANDIPRYQKTYEEGGAIICVQVDDMSNRSGIERILGEHGAVKVDRYGYAA